MQTKRTGQIVFTWALLLASHDVLSQGAGWDLSSDEKRAAVVAQLHNISQAEQQSAWQIAANEGWTSKGGGDGFLYELQAIRNARPFFYRTMNINAAISTAANLIRNTPPYNVSGAG